MKPLKELARTKFEKAAGREWDSLHFPIIIGFVYTSTPPGDRGLRDTVVKLCKDHLKPLLNRPEFESMMEDNGDFVKDLVKAIAHRPEPEPGAAKYRCGACRKSVIALLSLNQSFACPFCRREYAYSVWLSWTVKDE